MATLNQLVNKHRRKKRRKTKTPALKKCPHKLGLCIKVFTVTPRKPNSALRHVTRVRLSTGRRLIVFIPGEGYVLLRIHSSVLVSGKGSRDLPGIHYHAIRGLHDLDNIPVRTNARSKYGTKRLIIKI